MTTISISAIILGFYILLLLFLGVRAHARQTHQGYAIGERKLGLFTSICSMLAGQYNGSGVFFVFTFGLMVGYGALWFAFGFLFGYILLSFFAQRVNEEGRHYGDITVPDLLQRRIGHSTQHFSSFIIIGKACLFGTSQLLIAGTVVAALFGLSNIVGIFMTAGIIGVYVYLGGYLTVVRTDILQWSALFLIALSVAFFFPAPDLTDIVREMAHTSTDKKWGLFLFTFTMIISNADIWQRMMSVKTGLVGKVALRMSGILFVLFTLAMLIIVKSWHVESHVAFFDLFADQMLSPFMLSLLGTFTLIAVMSTIDTQVQLFSSALSKNVCKIDVEADKERFVFVSRIATILLLAGSALVASTLGNTMEFILKAFSFAYILAPIMIISMLWGTTGTIFKDRVCVIALLSGLCVYVFMFFNGYFSSPLNNVIPASVTAVMGGLGIVLGMMREKLCLLKRA